jgi:single-strand DNA-binding protein
MSQEAFATVAGYVTADPKLHTTTRTGTPVTHVRLACTPRRVDRDTGEWKNMQTSYFNVTCWRKLAVAVAASIHKGDPVIVRGRFRTRTWSDAERVRTEIEIEADAMGHDLTAGWSHFLRERPQSPGAADESGGESVRQMAAAADADDLDRSTEEGYAERSSDGPDDDAPGEPAAGGGPRAPIAPAEGSSSGESESDIFTERPMVELDQELDEATASPTSA